MADDSEIMKDYVEGYIDGKPLKSFHLNANRQGHDIKDVKHKIKERENALKSQGTQQTERLQKLQVDLKECNDQFVLQKNKLNELQTNREAELKTDQKQAIKKVALDTVDEFLVKRPRKNDDMKAVDVRYLPGYENAGHVHVGGEGAGSLDAKFHVGLDTTVQSLANIAAKYWALEDAEVFFLDRDGRIVPENMQLHQIILPPEAPHRDSDPSSRGEHQERYVVKGRNYCLLLVRAGTILHKEDLGKPKGESWQDFTFDGQQLNKELEQSRKKHGEQEIDPTKASMDLIPSLNDVIEEGRLRKKNQRQNLRCRCFEFLIFLLCWALFLALLRPKLAMYLNYIGTDIDRALSNFTAVQKEFYHLDSFLDVHTDAQYDFWFLGPYQQSVILPGLRTMNLAVLGAVAYVYEAKAPTPSSTWKWCSAVPPPTTTSTIAPNMTNMSDSTTATSANSPTTNTSTPSATTSDSTNATTTTSSVRRLSMSGSPSMLSHFLGGGWEQDREVPRTDQPWLSDTGWQPDRRLQSGCVSTDLQSCTNDRVISVLHQAQQDGHSIPRCTVQYPWNELVTEFNSFTANAPFAGVSGKVGMYHVGTPVNINYTTSEAFNASFHMLRSGKYRSAPAVSIVTFIYVPSLGGFFVVQMLAERTYSGSIVTSLTKYALDMTDNRAVEITLYVHVILLLALIVLMELRRIFQWPKWHWNDVEKEVFSWATVTFFLLTFIVLSLFVVYVFRTSTALNDIVKLNEQNTLTSDAMDGIFRVYILNTVLLFLQLVCVVLYCALFLRYLLLYFPYLHTLTIMVRKLVKPLAWAFFLSAIAISAFFFIFYLLFSSYVFEFRNGMWATLEVFRFACGNFRNWYQLYSIWSTVFLLLMIVALVLIKHLLLSLPISLMLSHKKEKDLFLNCSYHPYWADCKSKLGNRPEHLKEWETGFNPAKEPWNIATKQHGM